MEKSNSYLEASPLLASFHCTTVGAMYTTKGEEWASVITSCEPYEMQQWLTWQEIVTGTIATETAWELPMTFWLDFSPAAQVETHIWHHDQAKNIKLVWP